MNRYSTGPEGEAQPGSEGQVLRNRLGITSAQGIEVVESQALLVATDRAILETQTDQRFTAADICRLHKMWLGDIYDWAGEYRNVNMSKDGFPFAAAMFIPQLMQEFENGPLRRYTPCTFHGEEEQVEALAVTHAELILIHPFREGNGRCARLLAVLMGLQAGLPALKFNTMEGEGEARYIAAIHAAHANDYGPMQRVFGEVIRKTWELETGA